MKYQKEQGLDWPVDLLDLIGIWSRNRFDEEKMVNEKFIASLQQNLPTMEFAPLKYTAEKFIENYQYSNHRVGVHEYDNDIPE